MSKETLNLSLKFSEIIQRDKFNDVADKFRAYRLNADAALIKLKEANNVIDQLKGEINISRDVEANLRLQITSAQDRLIYLQKTNAKILTVSERIRQSEKTSVEIAQKVSQIEEVIQKVKEESQNLIKFTSNELDLMKKCDDLKLEIKNKVNEISLLKMENQALSKDKQNMEAETENIRKMFENDLEQLRREITEMQEQYEHNLQLYKKQIEDHELTIKEYERERKSFLEEFAMPKAPEGCADVATADSTVSLIPDDRSPRSSKSTENSMNLDDDKGNHFYLDSGCSQGNLPRYKKSKHTNFKPKSSCKQKPQLEFLISNSQKSSSDAPPPPKRRLFSMNCNHYAI